VGEARHECFRKRRVRAKRLNHDLFRIDFRSKSQSGSSTGSLRQVGAIGLDARKSHPGGYAIVPMAQQQGCFASASSGDYGWAGEPPGARNSLRSPAWQSLPVAGLANPLPLPVSAEFGSGFFN
jgi:hypothetical protein